MSTWHAIFEKNGVLKKLKVINNTTKLMFVPIPTFVDMRVTNAKRRSVEVATFQAIQI